MSCIKKSIIIVNKTMYSYFGDNGVLNKKVVEEVIVMNVYYIKRTTRIKQ